jgi:hypothetical protein
MTARDDLQRAIVDARRELADRLRPRLVAGADADAIAAAFMDWLAGRGLHLIPPPPVIRRKAVDPDTYRRGAQMARQALNAARTRTRTKEVR